MGRLLPLALLVLLSAAAAAPQLVGAARGDHSLPIIQVIFYPPQIDTIFMSTPTHLLLFVLIIIIIMVLYYHRFVTKLAEISNLAGYGFPFRETLRIASLMGPDRPRPCWWSSTRWRANRGPFL
ncbi:hypothetical protein VPH35_071641 [Triticum aestivum]